MSGAAPAKGSCLWVGQQFHEVGAGFRVVEVLVTGASGVLGSVLVDELQRRGHRVRRASRRPRDGWVVADATKPASLAAACAGMDAVVHCAADPFGRARAVEVEGIQALRAAAPRARLVYPSIVGCDRIRFSYYRVKSAAEQALAAAGGDYAILRLTQFHEFADRLARLPVPMAFVAMRAQTIAASDAAAALADVVEGTRRGRWDDVGGPEVHAMADLIRQRLRADGRHRPIVRVPVGVGGFRAGYNLCPERRVGRITWAEHLAGTSRPGA